MSIGDLTVTCRSYCYEVEDDDFRAIEKRDDDCETWEETLCARLEALDGVSRVDYNGHFGANIFFNIDADEDTHELNNKMIAMINDWAAGE